MLNNLEPGDIIITDDHFYKVTRTMRTLRGTLTSMHVLGKEGVERYINAGNGYPIELIGGFDYIKKSENVDIEELFDMERGRDELIEGYTKIQTLLPGAYSPTQPSKARNPNSTSWILNHPDKLTLSLHPDKREEELKKAKSLLGEAERKLHEAACNIQEGRKKHAAKYTEVAIENATYLETEEHRKKFCKAIKEAYHESFPWENQPFSIAYPRIYSAPFPEKLHAKLQENVCNTHQEIVKSLLVIEYLNILAENLYGEPIKRANP